MKFRDVYMNDYYGTNPEKNHRKTYRLSHRKHANQLKCLKQPLIFRDFGVFPIIKVDV